MTPEVSQESGRPNEIPRMPMLACAGVVSWLAFVASVLWRPHQGEYNPWMDVGLYNVPFGLSALASFTRSRRDTGQRAAWRALALGTMCFCGGNFYGSLIVRDSEIFPSPADALWLLSYVFVYIALVHFVRYRIVRFHPSMWLDGAVAGFGAAAIVVAFAMAPVLEQTEGRLSVVATTLAYPTADILLIVALVAAGMAMRTRSWSWWLLTCGMTVTCAADVVYMFRESAGTYSEGGILDAGWPLSWTLIGLAACTSGKKEAQELGQRQFFATPLVFATTSIALLVYGQGNQLHPVAIGLTIGAIASAVVRAALTVREVKALAASRQEARTDDLTGLRNRRAFIERFETMLASGEPHAVMIIDLDRFKEVNDGLGHDVGDDLLRAVAVRLREVLGVDEVARLGGDEFGALVDSLEPSQAVTIARRIIEALDAPFMLADVRVRIGASIGIALSPAQGNRRGELMRFADIAMYEAKRAQTEVAIYDAAHDPNTKDRLQTVEDLRTAITARRLALHYQPTIDIASGRVHGAEALVRWPMSDGTLRYPDSFIPLAERAGLIVQLTRAVLEQAVSFYAVNLRETHPELQLSVNISGHDLIDDALPTYVSGLLARHGMPAGQLTLEITETAVVADVERAQRCITSLRNLGIRVSIDDYGVGYSSMAQLAGLTVDELKIDKSFIMKLDGDHRMEAIVRSTIELAKALDLNVVAEGVEDAAALGVLRHLGCTIAQGYHIARPLTPDGLIRFLAARSAVRTSEAPLDRQVNVGALTIR